MLGSRAPDELLANTASTQKKREALHQNCILFPIFGTLAVAANCELGWGGHKEKSMNGLIYLVGLIVVILAILSFFGLR